MSLKTGNDNLDTMGTGSQPVKPDSDLGTMGTGSQPPKPKPNSEETVA